MKTEAKKAAAAPQELPMLALRGLVVFPKVIIHFDVAREKSVKALTAAANGSKLIFLPLRAIIPMMWAQIRYIPQALLPR